MKEIVEDIQKELVKHGHYVDTVDILNHCLNNKEKADKALADLKQNGKNSILVRSCKYK